MVVLPGSDSLYCLEILQILTQQNQDAPSKEISEFIMRSFLSVIKSCLQQQKAVDIVEDAAERAQDLLRYLQRVVSTFRGWSLPILPMSNEDSNGIK